VIVTDRGGVKGLGAPEAVYPTQAKDLVFNSLVATMPAVIATVRRPEIWGESLGHRSGHPRPLAMAEPPVKLSLPKGHCNGSLLAHDSQALATERDGEELESLH
jgi:hypothetical protein